jgi:Cof subfamily protein (haloacid dehalogenase superfamily)
VRDALQAASELGCAVTLATGRGPALARPIALQLGVAAPVILHSGALVQDLVGGAVLYQTHLPRAAAKKVVARVLAHGLQPLVYENVFQGDSILLGPEAGDNAATRRYLANKAERCRRLAPAELPGEADPLCISVLGEAAELTSLRRDLETAGGCHAALAVLPALDTHLLDILAEGCSKASALAFLAADRGLDMAEVIAVGDHANDLEMIRAAGLGVAMGNAPPEVRAAADWVAPSNDEDGLAVVIERFILPTREG